VQVVPVGYYKGSWFKPFQGTWQKKAFLTDDDGKYVEGVGGTLIEVPVQYCDSEDSKPQDGTLQASEDINGNGKLDPGNVATSNVDPAGRATGANGFIDFNVVYAKSFSVFSRVRIDVRVKVDGTESLVSQVFTLPIKDDDARADNPPNIPGSLDGPFGKIVSDQIRANGVNLANGAAVKPCSNPR
jgi:hypothetical protein